MIQHLCKIVWNRKRGSALIMLEIFISFLVVFAVTVLATQLYSGFHQPLGFEHQDVWDVTVSTGSNPFQDPPDDHGLIFHRILRELKALDPIISTAMASATPYVSSYMAMMWGPDESPKIQVQMLRASPSYRETLDLVTVAGRWFAAGDEQAMVRPVVISRNLAQLIFGSEDAVGKIVPELSSEKRETRIIGVVESFRINGEHETTNPIVFMPIWPGEVAGMSTFLTLEMAPGTPPSFEQEVMRTLTSIAPDFAFQIEQISLRRERHIRDHWRPLFLAVIIVTFLMIMVGLGLTGVLWQNVTQRTRELGLRRAKGATRRSIHGQILAEVWLMTTLSVVLAAAVVAQFPLLGLFGLSGKIVAQAIAMSALLLFLLTTLCGFYPSWLATRIHPAEALRSE